MDPLTIPAGTRCTFVAEGSANLVFTIDELPEGTSPAELDYFQGKPLPLGTALRRGLANNSPGMLLRVQKAGKAVVPVPERQAFWERLAAPDQLGRDNVVAQKLVRLRGGSDGDSSFISHLNALLADLDAAQTRRADWQGGRVDRGLEHALLVEDMRPAPGLADRQLLLEFKFKWLAQSPNAPAGSVRCRDCAKRALSMLHESSTPQPYCPLTFLDCGSSSGDHAKKLAQLVFPDLPADLHSVVAQWLQTTPVIAKLHDLQKKNDPLGVLKIADASSPGAEGLSLAMTLRDCACFLRIDCEEKALVSAKLGDLDQKHLRKLSYWREAEETLVDGGYYTGSESPLQENHCSLGC